MRQWDRTGSIRRACAAAVAVVVLAALATVLSGSETSPTRHPSAPLAVSSPLIAPAPDRPARPHTSATSPVPPPIPTSPPPRPSAPAAPAEEHRGGEEPTRSSLPVAKLQESLERWLVGQSAARSVAVGMALTGDVGPVWIGEAHLGDRLLRADDEYEVLSITKTFTEALVLREAAAGRIDLDAPIPPIAGLDVEQMDPAVTPRMLLQHTSGLVNYPNAAGYDPSRPITPRQIVSLAIHSPRLFPPGVRASYSNTNFHWLGLLLEHVTGRPFADLVADIAAEFRLARTRLDPTGRPGWIGYASGGIRSTLADVTRWGAALFTPGRVLSPPEFNALTTVGDAGVSLGLWPLCPCRRDGHGVRHPLALRQIIASGGFFFFPDQDVIVVVHYEPADTAAADAVAETLVRALMEQPTG